MALSPAHRTRPAFTRRSLPHAGSDALRVRLFGRIRVEAGRQNAAVSLPNRTLPALVYLLLHRGECMSRSQLLQEVWQMGEESGTNIVDVYINYLRRKVEAGAIRDAGARLIETVRGTGYRVGGTVHSAAGSQVPRPLPAPAAPCV